MEGCTEQLPQHLSALGRANEVRLARADMKRQIKAQQLAASDVLLDVPEHAEGMQVSELLLAQERWGRTRCRKVLAQIPVRENKRLGEMTDRQREALARLLPTSDAVAAAARRRASEHRRGAVSPALAVA